jgi:hypothetical protein
VGRRAAEMKDVGGERAGLASGRPGRPGSPHRSGRNPTWLLLRELLLLVPVASARHHNPRPFSSPQPFPLSLLPLALPAVVPPAQVYLSFEGDRCFSCVLSAASFEPLGVGICGESLLLLLVE